MKSIEKICQDSECQNSFKQFRSTDKYCSWKCAKKNQKTGKPKKTTRIRRVSVKRSKEERIYSVKRIVFLAKPENKVCFIDGCNSPSATIEHRRGRVGYADEWARDLGITLYLDERFWAGCCHFHNLELERDPELSKKYQLSKLHGGKKI